MDWNNNNDDAWGEMMNQYNEKMIPSKPDYPEPEPEPPSKKELMNNLLDALIIALEKACVSINRSTRTLKL